MQFPSFIACCLVLAISASRASNIQRPALWRYISSDFNDCPPTGIVYVPLEDCTKYLQCTNGVGREGSCPDPLYWNQVTKLCDYAVNVPECIGGTRPPLETEAPPTTVEVITEAPSTVPSTAAPTTPEPTTAEATTPEPTTTVEPTTPEPTTTVEPTTPEPTTPEPTTAEATTPEPTTAEPTTPAPTTPEPTTPEPTTVEPTTVAPSTTVEPTTTKPEYLIYSPNVTNWGDWDEEVSRCPAGTYAQGFQVKSETWIGPLFDDTSMNGLRLYCGDPLDETVTSVTSLEGSWGKWRNLYRCSNNGYVTGFQLKVEKAGIDLDETATNNIRILCSENVEPIEGDGENWGTWGDVQQCEGPNEAVCGIRTQVQPDRGVLLDDSALNNVAFLCCSL